MSRPDWPSAIGRRRRARGLPSLSRPGGSTVYTGESGRAGRGTEEPPTPRGRARGPYHRPSRGFLTPSHFLKSLCCFPPPPPPPPQTVNVYSLQRTGEVQKIAEKKIVTRQHGREVQFPSPGGPEVAVQLHCPASSPVKPGQEDPDDEHRRVESGRPPASVSCHRQLYYYYYPPPPQLPFKQIPAGLSCASVGIKHSPFSTIYTFSILPF